jgi:hypothetical protein
LGWLYEFDRSSILLKSSVRLLDRTYRNKYSQNILKLNKFLIILGVWMCESSGDILLAFNRCVDILWPNLSKILFDGISIHQIYFIIYSSFFRLSNMDLVCHLFSLQSFLVHFHETGSLQFYPIWGIHF